MNIENLENLLKQKKNIEKHYKKIVKLENDKSVVNDVVIGSSSVYPYNQKKYYIQGEADNSGKKQILKHSLNLENKNIRNDISIITIWLDFQHLFIFNTFFHQKK